MQSNSSVRITKLIARSTMPERARRDCTVKEYILKIVFWIVFGVRVQTIRVTPEKEFIGLAADGYFLTMSRHHFFSGEVAKAFKLTLVSQKTTVWSLGGQNRFDFYFHEKSWKWENFRTAAAVMAVVVAAKCLPRKRSW